MDPYPCQISGKAETLSVVDVKKILKAYLELSLASAMELFLRK